MNGFEIKDKVKKLLQDGKKLEAVKFARDFLKIAFGGSQRISGGSGKRVNNLWSLQSASNARGGFFLLHRQKWRCIICCYSISDILKSMLNFEKVTV